MPIALFSDLVSILTVHIYSFYIASARIFNWQLTIIISLFHLFRGKKRNVLRNRIDSCDYDLDQLLIGTILFTVLFFLLPTIVVFYLAFATARMSIITLKAALDTWLAFLNHFPLFALMLRVKDSQRLPGGIHFELREEHDKSSSADSPSVPYIHLEVCFPSNHPFRTKPSLHHKHKQLTKLPVNTTNPSCHVRPILPTGPPSPKTLPLAPRHLLPRNWPFRAPHPPPQPLQHAIQYASCLSGRNGRGVVYVNPTPESEQ
jgi:hypothetical protein